MMIVKNIAADNYGPAEKRWRFFCKCEDALHILEVGSYGNDLEFITYIGHPQSFWKRLTDAAKLIFIGERLVHEIFLSTEDSIQLTKILRDFTHDKILQNL